jgi:hypothetical protein
MITMPIWGAALALFVAFVLGFFMAAAFAAAGRADRRIEAEEGDVDALSAWQREAIGGDE